MWSTGYASRWRDTGDSPALPMALATPMPMALAMTTVRPVIARLASLVRSAGIAYIVGQVLIWHTFYTADPWRLTAPGLAVAWAVAATVRLRRRWPSLALVCADCAVYLALALGAAGCVPPSVRDDPFSWIVISVSGQLIVSAWYAPDALSPLLTFSAPLAYWVGAVLWPVTDIRSLLWATMMLVFIGLLHTLGRRALYGRAAVADAALDQADRAASEQYVLLTATIERREQERLLHDTVLNTLTALARAGAEDMTGVVHRCQGDVAAIQTALGAHEDPAAGGGRCPGDLLRELRAVVAELRARGLTVHLDTEQADTAAETMTAVPARVTAALANAAREALSNTAAHAGTAEAWVTIRLTARELAVTVRDEGAGFDPARVGSGRLGLRRSVTERTADCGGQASVWSAPGQGTVVRLCWPAAGALAPVSPPW